MQRRVVLATVGSIALSGCISAGEADGDEGSNDDDEQKTVAEAEYTGTTEHHVGTEITSVELDVNGPCRSTIYVEFGEQPPENGHVGVKMYKEGEEVGATNQMIGKFAEDKTRAHVNLPQCHYEKFDEYKLAVIQIEENNESAEE